MIPEPTPQPTAATLDVVTVLESTSQKPTTADMTTKVVKGSLWTLAGQVAPLAVSLVTTPITIHLLGAEGYGVYILIGLIPTYLGFADFGMSPASTKFASQAYAEGDYEKEARIVRTAALIALCTSVPFAIALILLSDWLVTLFSIPEHLLSEASLALRIASVTFVVNFLNMIFNTPQLVRLRMDLNSIISTVFRILGLILTPIALYLGFGVVGAVTVLLIVSVLTLCGHLFISSRLTRHLFDRTFDRPSIRFMLKFGGALAMSGIALMALINIEKGVLAATASSAALAHYSVAFMLASMMTMLSSSMTQSLIPAFSQLQSPENRDHLNSLYTRGIRFSLIWVVPVGVFLVLIAKPFFRLWVGEEFAAESTVPFYILAAGLVVNIPGFLPHTALLSSGRADVIARLYWLELIPYLILVWYLSVRFGVVGAATAWSIRVVSDTIFLFALAKRLTTARFQSQSHLGMLAAGALMLIPLILNFWLGLSSLTVVLSLACFILFLIVVFRFILDPAEVSWISTRF